VLLGCVFQEDAPFCWTPAKTMLGFLFCEVIESLGCKIRQGCEKKSKRRQRCAEFTQRLLTPLLLSAIFDGTLRPIVGMLDRQEVCLHSPLENPNHSQSQHIFASPAKNAWRFFPQSLRQGARMGCLCSRVCTESVLLIFLSYKGFLSVQ